MRILLMADTPPNPDSGAAGTEFQTVLAMRRLGHEVDVVWADELSHRIRHGNLHYLLELPRSYRKLMLEKMRSKSYDVVHVNQPHGYLAAKALRKQHKSTVFVHRSHGFEPRARDVLRGWQRIYAKKRSLSGRVASKAMETMLEMNNSGIVHNADGHIVSASLCADFLSRQYKVARERIAVIPQAPPKLYQEIPLPKFDAARLNSLLYVGQLAFFKAPMILAAAFERILESNPEATLTWVCDARHHSEASMLLNEHARSRIKFMDWVPQDQLIGIYDRHGVFLFPSFFEGFGKAFLEAMSRGLVVISSEEGGAKDLISSSDNGYLAAAGDVEAIVEAYSQVHTNPMLAEKLSLNARETAMTYTWDRVATETVDFYNRLLEIKSAVK